MLEVLILAVFLTFIAAASVWTGIVLLRAAGRERARRRKAAEAALLGGIRGYRADGDRAKLAEAVGRVDAALLFEMLPRALSVLRGDERDALETALARRRFGSYLRRRFRGFDETRRILACELLAALGGERSVERLEAALRDPAFRVRIAAAIALARRGALGDVPAAVAALGRRGRRSSRMVQMFAHLLPAQQGEIGAVAEDRREDPYVRVSALRALAAKASLDEAVLLRLAADPSPVVAMAVAALAVDYHYPAAPAILERMLASPSAAVRREAAARSHALQSRTLARPLQAALGDRDSSVVSAAARAIHARRRPPAEPLLLPSPSVPVQTAPARAAFSK